MARLTFALYGTWGDVAAFGPIADELAAREHDVTLLMPEELQTLMTSSAVRRGPLPVEFTPSRLFADRDALKARHAMRDSFERLQLPYLGAQYEMLEEAAGRSDLLVTNPIVGVVARMLHEKRGTPWVVGCHCPMFVPTAGRVPPQWPLPTLPGSPGRAVTRLAWKLQEQHHGRTNFDAGINEFRASIGLQPFRGNVLHSMESPFLTLMLMSEHFFPVPSDWPEHYRTVGFPTWNSNADPALLADIDAFITAGDAPVLVTRGTLGPVLSPDRFETIAEILDDLGVRSILTLGHGSDLTPALRDRPGVWPFVPLMNVLPRCRAVLHAGGLGTLAAVLTCGTPSVVAPESAESRWSARRTEALGLGVGLRRRPPSRRILRRALEQVLADDGAAARASELGAKLRQEHSAAASADEIERLVQTII